MEQAVGELLYHANSGNDVKGCLERLPHIDAPIDTIHGWNALHIASAAKDAKAVAALLASGANTESTSREHLHTALHIACSLGCEEVVQVLLHNNARLNAKDSHGQLPLHYAAMEGYRATVETILDHIRNSSLEFVIEPDNQGNTALSLAQAAHNQSVANVIQQFQLVHLPTSMVDEDEVNELTSWLTDTVGLKQYVSAFIAAGYTRLSFWSKVGITDQEYAKIGVTLLGHKKILNKFLNEYTNNNTTDDDSDS